MTAAHRLSTDDPVTAEHRADNPRHVAIIMDGNGRWATERGFLRVRGHRKGVEAVRETTRACARRHLDRLTLYALSTENYLQRPREEIAFLMRMLKRFLIGERDEIRENNIRLTHIGRVHELPRRVLDALAKSEELSEGNTGMTLCLALNYGGRQEISDAVRSIAKSVAAGELDPDHITPETIAAGLYDPAAPDPDLVIRTAGEMRFSNFLLWQISYAEFYSTDVLWPDFGEHHLDDAFAAYRQRRRKFGGIVPLASR